MPTYSISVRLRRITTEEAYVSLPVTSELVHAEAKPGEPVLMEKISAAAIEQATRDSTTWTQEGDVVIELHPIEKASPEGNRSSS
jgi:hypothetical protein